MKAIYHLTPASHYQAQVNNRSYSPPAFSQEGFIHCTSDLTILLQVANAYFADLEEPLLALVIDPQRLTAPLKFEPPTSPPQTTAMPAYATAAGTEPLFPHIYGILNREAIVDSFALSRDISGQWSLP